MMNMLFLMCGGIVFVLLIFCLASWFKRTLALLIVAISLGVIFNFIFPGNDYVISGTGLLKFLCAVWGLLAIVGFLLLPNVYREGYLFSFTIFVNCAVLFNIGMMVFVPAGETIRGLVIRGICLLLLVWLVLLMKERRYRTVQVDSGFFLFSASPLVWIVCHAAYRSALVSLPSFNGLYLLIEPLTFLVMYLFFRVAKRKRPISYYFGFADTLVVSALAMWEQLFIQLGVGEPTTSNQLLIGATLDKIYLPFLAGVGVVSMWGIGKELKKVKASQVVMAEDS